LVNRVVVVRSVVKNLAWVCLTIAATSLVAKAEGPFTLTPKVSTQEGARRVEMQFDIPAKHILYADKLSFAWTAGGLTNSFALPAASTVVDKFSGHEKRVFTQSFSASCPIPTAAAYPLTLEVHFQGCDEANCYFPEERKYSVASDGTIKAVAEDASDTAATPAPSAGVEWKSLAENFTVVARGSGYLGEKEFLSFLTKAKSGQQVGSEAATLGTGWSAVLSVLVILLGGMALNLTPCVLPLIPINLAIIGAGSRAGSRARGFALGGAYAAGMALAYGILGLVVVLTGSKFGTLNSSPWFNLAIAAIFIVLALGMFDKINIDFSRLTGGTATKARGSKGSFVLAYSMGTIAALLAGACVAPVVISVLLQATQLYAAGVVLGLLLPFVLGLGMALPWPFLGAGLSFMPKPGGWMTKVKYGFGFMITAFALYYLHLAVGGFRADFGTAAPTVARSLATPGEAPATEDAQTQLGKALAASLAEKKPIFIDFWASWCKNCSAMEHTTFAKESVRQELEHFTQVRLQAEKPNQQPVKPILDYFGAMGLPTYVVLIPKNSPNTNTTASVALRTPDDSTPAKRF